MKKYLIFLSLIIVASFITISSIKASLPVSIESQEDLETLVTTWTGTLVGLNNTLRYACENVYSNTNTIISTRFSYFELKSCTRDGRCGGIFGGDNFMACTIQGNNFWYRGFTVRVKDDLTPIFIYYNDINMAKEFIYPLP